MGNYGRLTFPLGGLCSATGDTDVAEGTACHHHIRLLLSSPARFQREPSQRWAGEAARVSCAQQSTIRPLKTPPMLQFACLLFDLAQKYAESQSLFYNFSDVPKYW